MGCDIHLWVEVLRGGRWEFAHEFRFETYDVETWIEYPKPYDGRNYFLFGILADVRNCGGVVRPISPPRGMPSDLSVTGGRIVEQEGPDAHSLSWLSADELLAHDWETKVSLKGYVTPDEEERYRRTGKGPDKWYGCPFGRSDVELKWESTEHELCREFVDSFIQRLEQYGPRQIVRVCFFFDN